MTVYLYAIAIVLGIIVVQPGMIMWPEGPESSRLFSDVILRIISIQVLFTAWDILDGRIEGL